MKKIAAKTTIIVFLVAALTTSWYYFVRCMRANTLALASFDQARSLDAARFVGYFSAWTFEEHLLPYSASASLQYRKFQPQYGASGWPNSYGGTDQLTQESTLVLQFDCNGFDSPEMTRRCQRAKDAVESDFPGYGMKVQFRKEEDVAKGHIQIHADFSWKIPDDEWRQGFENLKSGWPSLTQE